MNIRQKSKSVETQGQTAEPLQAAATPQERFEDEPRTPSGAKPTGLRGGGAEVGLGTPSEEERAREVGREFLQQNAAYFRPGEEPPLGRLSEALREAGLPVNSDTMAYCAEGFEETLNVTAVSEQFKASAQEISMLTSGEQEQRVRDLLVEIRKVDPSIRGLVFEDEDEGVDGEGDVLLDVIAADGLRYSLGDQENGISKYEGYAENLAYALSVDGEEGVPFQLSAKLVDGSDEVQVVRSQRGPKGMAGEWFRSASGAAPDRVDLLKVVWDAVAYFYLGDHAAKREHGDTDNVFVEGAYRTRVTERREADSELHHAMSVALLEREGQFGGATGAGQASLNAFMDGLVADLGPQIEKILWPKIETSGEDDE